MERIGIGLLVAASALSACEPQPVRRTSAAVVNIAPGLRPKWDADKVQVTVRTADDLVGLKDVPLAELACRVGDTVQVSVQGLAVTLDDRACVRSSQRSGRNR